MRMMLCIPVLVLVGACNVDTQGNGVTVQYDQNTAENAASDIGNTAQNVGGFIANDVQEAADKVQNTDVDVDVSNTADGNAQ